MYIDSGSGKAILLIDITEETLSKENTYGLPSKIDVIRYVAGELNYFREKMRPVFFCYTLRSNEAHYQAVPHLTPRMGEATFLKTKANAFFNTGLASALHEHKVNKLTIVGAYSHKDILLTSTAALDHGFKTIVPETCLLWSDEVLHEASLKLLSALMG